MEAGFLLPRVHCSAVPDLEIVPRTCISNAVVMGPKSIDGRGYFFIKENSEGFFCCC